MKMGDALKLATTFLKEGITVQLIPIVYEDKDFLSARVLIPDIEVIGNDALEQTLKITREYDCQVYIRDKIIIYE